MASGIERVREARAAFERAWNGENVARDDLRVRDDDILDALLQLDDRLHELENRPRYEQLR